MAIYIKPITSTPKSNNFDLDSERALEREIEAAEAAKRNTMFPGYKPSFSTALTAQTPVHPTPTIPWLFIILGVAAYFMLENK